MLQTICKNKTVLDAYCYTGGFGIYCAKGGAKRVTCVDTSLPSLTLARQSAILNGLNVGSQDLGSSFKRTVTDVRAPETTDTAIDNVDIEFVLSESVRYMTNCARENKVFDIVICDPPKLARAKKFVNNAVPKYVVACL
jgi:23S rRNA (cytosine1962-C5)-methyltransferase